MNRGYKNYLTREKNDKLKRERYVFLHSDTRKVADVFPDIERIEITYIQTHKAAIEIKPKENSIVFTPQSEDVFIIECLNDECTFGWYYDLRNDIYNMRRNHLTEYCGEKNCQGQEAPDHPEQSCGGSLRYTINIVYK